MCYVVCLGENCWCSLGENYDRDAMPDHHFHDQVEAIAAWNHRASLPPALERMLKEEESK